MNPVDRACLLWAGVDKRDREKERQDPRISARRTKAMEALVRCLERDPNATLEALGWVSPSRRRGIDQ
jgi:hypothetical protein